MSGAAPLRIFFVAGESSGDTHGANLIRALRSKVPAIACEGLGGVRMAEAGMTLRFDLAGRAIMGFAEVIKSLGWIRRLFLDTVARLEALRPDCLVLIDYPGFNIRLAKAAHALGIPVIYYISPQVWAWKKKRIHTLARVCRAMLVTFPFEKPLYDAVGLDCTYVGHPLLDHIGDTAAACARQYETLPDRFTIGMLPGSRAQEIGRILPVMIESARRVREAHPGVRFAIPCVDEDRRRQIEAIAGDFPADIAVGGAHDILREARFCFVASGTATVETALFGAPMVILYRVAPFTYWLAKRLVTIEHIGMVNILAGRRLVPEFVQHEAKPAPVADASLTLIADTEERRRQLDGLAEVREALGGGGASERAADAILSALGRSHHG